MKPQSRLMSHLESLANIAVGIGAGIAVNYFMLPLFGAHDVGVHAAAGVTLVMTAISWARSYSMRRLFERVRAAGSPPMFDGIVAEIAAERMRQIHGEGYSLSHDDAHGAGEIACAAAAYAYAASFHKPLARQRLIRHPENTLAGELWRWNIASFKPTTPRRDLVKAAAMIVAEIGRLDRKSGRGILR